MKTFASVICAMLLIAQADMPYGYYTILKISACGFFVYLALNLPTDRTLGAAYLAWSLALVYNPFFRIPLGREVWSVVNIMTVVACLYLVQKAKRNIANEVSKEPHK